MKGRINTTRTHEEAADRLSNFVSLVLFALSKMKPTVSREKILESTRDRENFRSSVQSFESDTDEVCICLLLPILECFSFIITSYEFILTHSNQEAHYLFMYVLYMKASRQFIDKLPQIQRTLLMIEDSESLNMTARMEMLTSIVDSCSDSFNLDRLVEDLCNRPPLPFREQPLKGNEKSMNERELFEHAIISCWSICPTYSRGLHSVVEYLAEKMDAKELENFSPAFIQTLSEISKEQGSTGKAARSVLVKGGYELETGGKIDYTDNDGEEDVPCVCFTENCVPFFQGLANICRGFLDIEYREEYEDKMTYVQVQVEPERF